MKKALMLCVLAALLLPPAAAPAAVRTPEILLGSRTVDFAVDHDEIVVGRVRGYFRKLEFRVSGNALEMFDMKVVYTNGTRDDIPTALIFQEGSWSRIIDLEGGRRRIRKITFNYRTIGPRREGKALIKVFGIR